MTLNQMIRTGFTFQQAQDAFWRGTISEATWRRFEFLWCWSASRTLQPYGARHDRAYARLGSERYWRRIERVQRWVEAIKATPSEPAPTWFDVDTETVDGEQPIRLSFAIRCF